MKTAFGGLVVAVLLLAAGAMSWGQARITRRLADSHRRLATLRYDLPEDDADGGFARAVRRLPGPVSSLREDEQRHRATVTYWLARYQSLTELTSDIAAPAPSDPAILLMAANAAFRASAPRAADRRAALDRLDGVIQGYAEVLRREPSFADASYNYEFVVKLRDAIAKAPAPGRAARDRQPVLAAPPAEVNGDLPAGATIHGRPGGPPEGTDMSDFKTITPMRYDEREETEPGRGGQIRRRG